MSRRLVIIGASLAGSRAAAAARSRRWDGEIVVVGEERHPPYTRPPLSKELLTSGEQDVADHLLRAEEEATWLLDECATRLDRDARRVGLAGGEELEYDRLVIATGSRPRRWTGPGAELAGVHAIRTVDDALALREAFAGGPRVAIIGAGFIGCEIASSAWALGLEVTMFDIARRRCARSGRCSARRCAQLHRAHGVKLALGVGLAALHGRDGSVDAVELTDGTRHAADLVVIALGAVPCTDWLADSGLAIDRGVRCDATLTVDGDPDLLAAGDVAAWPHPLTGGELVRVEHWTNAAEQGALAGRNAVADHAERTSSRASRRSGRTSSASGSRPSASRTWASAATSSRSPPTAAAWWRWPSATACSSARSASTPPGAFRTTAAWSGARSTSRRCRRRRSTTRMRSGRPSSCPHDRARKDTVTDSTLSLADIDLTNADVFATAIPYDAFALLRREDPVHFNPERNGPGFWAVTRYEDIRTIHRDSETFSSEIGGITLEELAPENVEARKSMIDMDPPRHDELRGMLNRRFTRQSVSVWEELIRSVVVEVLDEALPLGEFDFVKEVSEEIPMRVFADIMGIPQEERHEIVRSGTGSSAARIPSTG